VFRATFALRKEAMPRADVSIPTRDGNCPASIFTPADGAGPWPGVIFLMDAPGIRPVMFDMCQRLADFGYFVLLPDLFYRFGSYPTVLNPAEVFADPVKRETMMTMVKSLDRDKKVSDGEAFIAYLTASPNVKGDRFGTTGYCMGGNFALTIGGAFPDRLAAIASFHGGGLATDAPDSPHLFVRGITGRVYVAGSIEDASFPDEQKERLERALTDTGVAHLVETYPAHHGFAVPDIPAFDATAAERHWKALADLFGETLA
jgi:carboxymethylenebutenolidase